MVNKTSYKFMVTCELNLYGNVFFVCSRIKVVCSVHYGWSRCTTHSFWHILISVLSPNLKSTKPVHMNIDIYLPLSLSVCMRLYICARNDVQGKRNTRFATSIFILSDLIALTSRHAMKYCHHHHNILYLYIISVVHNICNIKIPTCNYHHLKKKRRKTNQIFRISHFKRNTFTVRSSFSFWLTFCLLLLAVIQLNRNFLFQEI